MESDKQLSILYDLCKSMTNMDNAGTWSVQVYFTLFLCQSAQQQTELLTISSLTAEEDPRGRNGLSFIDLYCVICSQISPFQVPRRT